MKRVKKLLIEIAAITVVVAPLAFGYQKFFGEAEVLDETAGMEYEGSGRTCVDLLDECHNINAEQYPMRDMWFKEVRQMERDLDRCEKTVANQRQLLVECNDVIGDVKESFDGK